jgi:hypothetical protein
MRTGKEPAQPVGRSSSTPQDNPYNCHPSYRPETQRNLPQKLNKNVIVKSRKVTLIIATMEEQKGPVLSSVLRH